MNRPVTHVAEVAVKKRSTHEIGTVRETARESAIVPTKIVKKNEKKIVEQGNFLAYGQRKVVMRLRRSQKEKKDRHVAEAF